MERTECLRLVTSAPKQAQYLVTRVPTRLCPKMGGTAPPRSKGGCGCRTGGGNDNTGAESLVIVLALLGVRRRRTWLRRH